jgi:hypothetical protein
LGAFRKGVGPGKGIDPRLITKNSPLLAPDIGFWGGVKEGCGCVVWLWLALLLVVWISAG